MKRALIESAILAALVLGLEACERDAISAARSHQLAKGHDGSSSSGQIFDMNDGGPREVAPVAPLMTGGSGGTLVTGGPGGTFGTGGSGGTGGTGGTGGGATGGTGGTMTGGTGGIGGMATGGSAGTKGGAY
jgi:hypothetical protein